MTKQEFASLTDDDDILEAAFSWTEKYCPITHTIKKFNSAPKPARNVHAMLHLDAQVLNGGFPQFYHNGYHEYGFEYAAAFRDAALDTIADLVEGADACFLSVKDTMPQNKNDLAAFSKWYDDNPLNEFDAVYADCQDEIREKIALYIRQNITYFGD